MLGYVAQGDYTENHNGRRNDSKTSQPVKFGSKKITNGPADFRAVFSLFCFLSHKRLLRPLISAPLAQQTQTFILIFVLPSSFVVYLLASEEEIIFLHPFYFVNLTSSCSLIHWHWAKHVWLYNSDLFQVLKRREHLASSRLSTEGRP